MCGMPALKTICVIGCFWGLRFFFSLMTWIVPSLKDSARDFSIPFISLVSLGSEMNLPAVVDISIVSTVGRKSGAAFISSLTRRGWWVLYGRGKFQRNEVPCAWWDSTPLSCLLVLICAETKCYKTLDSEKLVLWVFCKGRNISNECPLNKWVMFCNTSSLWPAHHMITEPVILLSLGLWVIIYQQVVMKETSSAE